MKDITKLYIAGMILFGLGIFVGIGIDVKLSERSTEFCVLPRNDAQMLDGYESN